MAAGSPNPHAPVPRGRHAPPLEVRQGIQRRRLFEAASRVFDTVGYADAGAESISREAGMSKATFYEHFANKEECMLALFDEARDVVTATMAEAAGSVEAATSYDERAGKAVNAFVEAVAQFPDSANTVLFGIIAAGPKAAERRDLLLQHFTQLIYYDNHAAVRRFPEAKAFRSEEDAFAVIGAFIEIVVRRLRAGEDVREAEPLLRRVYFGILSQQ